MNLPHGSDERWKLRLLQVEGVQPGTAVDEDTSQACPSVSFNNTSTRLVLQDPANAWMEGLGIRIYGGARASKVWS